MILLIIIVDNNSRPNDRPNDRPNNVNNNTNIYVN